jgi:hypothetical protein
MNVTFNEYLEDIKSQLCCNIPNLNEIDYITYDFTNEQIDENLDYFQDCLNRNLSGYKALLFFNEYLSEQ